MCQVLPRRVLQVDGGRAQVDLGGVPTWVDAALVPALCPGDYVLVHAGLALEQVASDEAELLLSMYASLDDTFEVVAE
jgi:hydrogenase expression/formation protein HypC